MFQLTPLVDGRLQAETTKVTTDVTTLADKEFHLLYLAQPIK